MELVRRFSINLVINSYNQVYVEMKTEILKKNSFFGNFGAN